MKNWWKILGAIFVIYSIIAGFLLDVPRLPILNETIRNLYFHVTMWFAMFGMLLVSLVYSIKSLAKGTFKNDSIASEAVNVGMVFATAGIITGSLWARFTWGDWWTNDVKLNGTVVTMLIYTAYIILRGSIEDPEKKARISAVYNIFAFVLMIVFIGILPRLNDSLHPGNGGNPAFGTYDLNNTMRLVFYPAIIGWFCIGMWILQLKVRMKKIAKSLTLNY